MRRSTTLFNFSTLSCLDDSFTAFHYLMLVLEMKKDPQVSIIIMNIPYIYNVCASISKRVKCTQLISNTLVLLCYILLLKESALYI